MPHTHLLRSLSVKFREPASSPWKQDYINAPISSLATLLSSGCFPLPPFSLELIGFWFTKVNLLSNIWPFFPNCQTWDLKGSWNFMCRSSSSRRNWQKIKSWYYKLSPTNTYTPPLSYCHDYTTILARPLSFWAFSYSSVPTQVKAEKIMSSLL